MKSAATILGTAQDFRFLNKADSQCINSMTLTGFRPNESISCSESRQIRHIAMANISGYAEFELNLPANVDVQMVWIVAEGMFLIINKIKYNINKHMIYEKTGLDSPDKRCRPKTVCSQFDDYLSQQS